jgi:hypothetical protein
MSFFHEIVIYTAIVIQICIIGKNFLIINEANLAHSVNRQLTIFVANDEFLFNQVFRKNKFRAGGGAQVEEDLPSECEALSSILVLQKKRSLENCHDILHSFSKLTVFPDEISVILVNIIFYHIMKYISIWKIRIV